MALIKCKECNNEVSNRADSCPKCGIKIEKRSTLLTALMAIILIAFTFQLLLNYLSDDSKITRNQASIQKSLNPPTEDQPNKTKEESVKNEPNWFYNSSTDPMSSEASKSAITLSTNTTEFAFPYHGKQHARLGIRNHPRHGKDIIFAIEKGQILCRSYKDCDVLVRFDDSPARTMKAIGSSDNSSETIFIHNFDVFFNEMKKSKKVRISTEIYKEGSPVFEFDVSNFDESKVQ